MDFNQRIAFAILLDLQAAKALTLSFKILEERVRINLGALDSTFPKHIKAVIEGILPKIKAHQGEQYAATLNTPREGEYDENFLVENFLDYEIDCLKNYVHSDYSE